MHPLLQESSIKPRIQTLPCGFTQSIVAALALTKSMAGNVDRGNEPSTLQRVNKWAAASTKIQGFLGIYTALSDHLRRSVFAAAYRRLEFSAGA
jgi:hypothetical protein